MKHQNLSHAAVCILLTLGAASLTTWPGTGGDTKIEEPSPMTGEFRVSGSGVTFRRTHQLTGANDVVESPIELCLAPSGKFLLQFMRVIPLDGQPSFKLVDFSAGRNTLSPDGKKVAFYAGSIWMITIAPETGKPSGRPEKLVEGNDWWYQMCVEWCPDSARFVFWKEGNLYVYSIPERRITPLTQGLGMRTPGECSPDGKSAVYWDDQAIWQVDLDEPQPRKIIDVPGGQRYVQFSPDGKWVFFHNGSQLSFVRIADTNRVEIKLPETVGRSFARSSDRKKLLFYKSSSESKEFWRFISTSGGKSFGPAPEYQLSPGWGPCWSPDSRFVVLWSEREDQRGCWVVPLSGDTPFPLKLSVSLEGKLEHEAISLNGQSLLFSTAPPQKPKSYWVVPVSVREGKSAGAPLKVCEQDGAQDFLWSPNGKRLAWQQKDAIWTARSDGSDSEQLPAGSEKKFGLEWIPDGSGLSWTSYLSSSPPRAVLHLATLSSQAPSTLLEGSMPARIL
jgi:Tol biopolymer transport system component